MYEDDTPFSDQQSGLSQELLKELVYSPHLRPEIPESLIRELDGKLKRTAPGYAPTDGEELLLWIKERLFIPTAEEAFLFAAMERDIQSTAHNLTLEKIKYTLGDKVVWLHLLGAEQPGLCAMETLHKVAACLDVVFSDLTLRPLTSQATSQMLAGLNKATALFERETAAEPGEFRSDTALFVNQWLSYYCPVPRDFVGWCLGLPAKVCSAGVGHPAGRGMYRGGCAYSGSRRRRGMRP